MKMNHLYLYKWTALCKFLTRALFGIGSSIIQPTCSHNEKLGAPAEYFCEQRYRAESS